MFFSIPMRMKYLRSAQLNAWYEFCKCEYNKKVAHMNQIDQVLQEEERKSTVWSGISQKARGKPVTISLNKEFCKSCEICVETCPIRCLEMNGVYPLVRVPKGTKRLSLSALEAGVELAIESDNTLRLNAEYLGDKKLDLGKDFNV
jgi:ferredoxin